MKATQDWIARAWLPYTLAGVTWVTIGALLGQSHGVGLIFIGLSCLALGLSGAARRIRR